METFFLLFLGLAQSNGCHPVDVGGGKSNRRTAPPTCVLRCPVNRVQTVLFRTVHCQPAECSVVQSELFIFVRSRTSLSGHFLVDQAPAAVGTKLAVTTGQIHSNNKKGRVMSLTLEHVSRVIEGQTWIDDANLRFEAGSFNVLLGRTLSGKTSLMRLMAGLDKPDSGRILMNGVDVTAKPVRLRNVAMVYQQFINYPTLTVFENIASPLRQAGVSNELIQSKVLETAKMLRIEKFLQRFPLELSGGQQQRTAMARALVKDAELILFDEPLVNLDYKLREELRQEMRELFKARHTIAIYA